MRQHYKTRNCPLHVWVCGLFQQVLPRRMDGQETWETGGCGVAGRRMKGCAAGAGAWGGGVSHTRHGWEWRANGEERRPARAHHAAANVAARQCAGARPAAGKGAVQRHGRHPCLFRCWLGPVMCHWYAQCVVPPQKRWAPRVVCVPANAGVVGPPRNTGATLGEG